jgi:ketosteroid isomerase-like protein
MAVPRSARHPHRFVDVQHDEEDAGRMGDLTPEREHPDASAVIERLVAAMNEHDLDRMIALFHPDYESRQPAHPGRDFTGRDQVRANWAAMFGGVPDFRAELLRSVQDGDLSWTEWAWRGIRSDGQSFEVRGVTLFEIRDGAIVAGTLYVEDVEPEAVGIEDAVEGMSGARPE